MDEARNIRYIQRSLYRIPVFIQIIPVKLFVSYVISRDLLAFVISRFVIDRFYCTSFDKALESTKLAGVVIFA